MTYNFFIIFVPLKNLKLFLLFFYQFMCDDSFATSKTKFVVLDPLYISPFLGRVITFDVKTISVINIVKFSIGFLITIFV